MNAGIILAGGRGKRFGAERAGKNKVTAQMTGKPLVVFGVDLFAKTLQKTVVVVGVMGETVREAVGGREVTWAVQPEPRGTGDATRVGVEAIEQSDWADQVAAVMVGYGDHMMFYTEETVEQMLKLQRESAAGVVMVTSEYEQPDELGWGRVVRNSEGDVEKVVEQKEVGEEERKIKEVNAGFYCFDYQFLVEGLGKLKPAAVSGEYYVTDMVEIAKQMGRRVVAVKLPFDQVGYGVNTQEDLVKSGRLAADEGF